MAPDGYAYAVLADGARPFLHRPGARALLGVPEDTGVAVSFTPAAQGRSFRYVHEHGADPMAPSGWDDLLAEPGITPDPPVSWLDPPTATAGTTTPVRTGAVARAGQHAAAERDSARGAEALSHDPEPNTVSTANTAKIVKIVNTAATTAPTTALPTAAGPSVVAELVIPGGPPRPSAASGTRPRTTTTGTRRSAPGPARQGDAGTAVAPPEAVPAPTARHTAALPVPPGGPHRTAPAGPGRSAAAPTPRTATEVFVSATDSHALESEPRNEPAWTTRREPPRGPRDEPSTVPVPGPGPSARVPSRAPRDRRPVTGATPPGAPPRPDAVDDPFTPWTGSARRSTTPPYRKAGPPPSPAATPRTTEPAPAAPATPRPPAPSAVPAAPAPVLVVRAPAAPTGEAAFWERRHLGRLLNGVVR